MTHLNREELVAEAEWLLAGGVHPLLAAQELKRPVATIGKYAYSAGRMDTARLFQRAASQATRDRDAR